MVAKILGRAVTSAAAFFLFALIATTASPLDAYTLSSEQRREMLPPRERAFLNIVFSGDEAKSVEYVQAAGINPNSIGGEPLSAWLFHFGPAANINVQRIVFERFRQNPNPPNIGKDTDLSSFCDMPGLPNDIRVAVQGTPEQKADLAQRQDAARRANMNAVAASFQSLLRFGVKDKAILTQIFLKCLGSRSVQPTGESYDILLAPMVKAGANINGNGETRPLRDALRFDKVELVEKLVADGADVTYRPSSDAARNANSQAACQPRADQSLYQSVLGYARPRNEEAALRIIRALASKGLSPMAKWGYGEQGQCKYVSLYDLVIDTGNLAYASRIKEAAQKPPVAAKPQSTTETPATPPSTSSAEIKPPEKIGAWQIKTDNGRLVAIARAKNLNNTTNDINNGFAALRLECVAGKLEYVPIALKLGTMTSLWIESADDITNEFRLVNQRLSGASATALANDVAVTEAVYRRNGTAEWGTGMNVESSSAPMDQVMMTGFSEMRAFMRANCKR